VLSIVRQVADALRYLHRRGYVHQDIKPGNILVDRTGRALLADFGIGHSFVSAAMVVGSPAYQAPEALDDAAAAAAAAAEPQKEDVWALGVTLFQLLFGRLPFPGDSLFEIVRAINLSRLEVPVGTPKAVEDIIRMMLTVDPARRCTIDELLQNDIIRNADETARDLPDVPAIKMREGSVIALNAERCHEGYAFADVSHMPRKRAVRIAGIAANKPTHNWDDDGWICNRPEHIHHTPVRMETP
jgi:serine/threonine-protein kinase 11